MLNELLWFDNFYKINQDQYKFLLELSWIIDIQYKFDGFDWYANYVLKHNLYVWSHHSSKIHTEDILVESYDDWFLTFLEKTINLVKSNTLVCFLKNYILDYDYHGMSDKDIDNFIYFLFK